MFNLHESDIRDLIWESGLKIEASRGVHSSDNDIISIESWEDLLNSIQSKTERDLVKDGWGRIEGFRCDVWVCENPEYLIRNTGSKNDFKVVTISVVVVVEVWEGNSLMDWGDRGRVKVSNRNNVDWNSNIGIFNSDTSYELSHNFICVVSNNYVFLQHIST